MKYYNPIYSPLLCPNDLNEDFSKYSGKDFLRFLIIATISCAEVSLISHLIGDQGHLNEDASIGLFNLYNMVQSKITRLIILNVRMCRSADVGVGRR